MNSQDHVQAVLDLLTAAAAGTEIDVYDGQAPNNAQPPYQVVYPEAGVASRLTLQAVSSHLSMVVQITSVGASRWQAIQTADKAREALLDVVPVVAGRSCWPITQEFSQPVRPDSTNPTLFVAIAGYRIRSD